MRTRSALFVLFLVLVAVPVGAAVYLGTAGLARERDMLIDRERDAMERRANEIRDAFVRELQQLYRAEQQRPVSDYWRARVREIPPIVPNDRRAPTHDYFQFGAGGQVEIAWGTPDQVPPDLLAFAASETAQVLLDPQTPLQEGRAWLVPAAEVASRYSVATRAEKTRVLASTLDLHGDLAVRGVMFEGGTRIGQGFRLDAARIDRRLLDPVSPHSVVPRRDERLEEARLVRDDERLRVRGTDALGLPRVIHRAVATARHDDPVLLPRGYLLAISLRPAASLAGDLEAAEERLAWTLGIVAFVVALGLVFGWRALRAETRLAARKAEFVSAVSHELRTPLTSIRMYADMLKEGWVDNPETAREYFGLMSAESERLARLVNNVLDFSNIEKGKKEFDMRIGDPAPVVRDVAEVLRPYLKEKGFALVVKVPKKLPACSFDKDALTQILVNLIDNAVKYGNREVRVEAEGRNGAVVFRVLDRGPGVPREERERIFDPFRRGARATNSGGSGLGLALVRHFAAAHRGRVEVTDRDGGGAVFALSLPAA